MTAKRKLDQFQLHDSIGMGTVGTIYSATDLANDCPVAVKILLPTVSDDKLILARFEREMLILEKLSHRNIVRYYGGGREGKQLFYSMELVSGGSLKEMVAGTGRLPWREAATIGVQVCSALQHAHNHGIIHRDLKPANLLFTEDGDVKLSDFGIALDANATTITTDGLTVGSYFYMPPEQIHGERSVTGKADLYAFGCVLFESLTGSPPYSGDNFAQIFEQHLTRQPPHVRDVEPTCPPKIDALVTHLLEKSPEARPFNARSVQGVLMDILDPAPQGESAASHQLDTEDDVPASQAVIQGQQALSQRINLMQQNRAHGDVSWPTLGVLLLIVLAIVCIAWVLSG